MMDREFFFSCGPRGSALLGATLREERVECRPEFASTALDEVGEDTADQDVVDEYCQQEVRELRQREAEDHRQDDDQCEPSEEVRSGEGVVDALLDVVPHVNHLTFHMSGVAE